MKRSKAETAAELAALLPAVLDKAFKKENCYEHKQVDPFATSGDT